MYSDVVNALPDDDRPQSGLLVGPQQPGRHPGHDGTSAGSDRSPGAGPAVEPRLRRSTHQLRKHAAQFRPIRGGDRSIRNGDPAQSQLRRGSQQSGICSDQYRSTAGGHRTFGASVATCVPIMRKHIKTSVSLWRPPAVSKKPSPHYQQSINLNPDYLEAYTNLVTAYVQVHRSAEAIAVAQKALALARSQGQTAAAQQIEAWLNSNRAAPPQGSRESSTLEQARPSQ